MPVVVANKNSPVARRQTRRASRRKLTLRVVVLAVAIAALFIALHYAEFEWSDVPGWLENVNRPLALAMMALLPIFGFPISAVYLAVGAIFGPAWGGLVVAGITLVHVGATQVLARTVLKERIRRWREGWSRRLPVISEGDNISMVAMIVIVPGLPYLARNCLLAVSDVPLRYLFGVGVPLYIARSYTTLFLGNVGNNPSAKSLWIIGSVFAVKLAISALLFKRLRWKARRKAAH